MRSRRYALPLTGLLRVTCGLMWQAHVKREGTSDNFGKLRAKVQQLDTHLFFWREGVCK